MIIWIRFLYMNFRGKNLSVSEENTIRSFSLLSSFKDKENRWTIWLVQASIEKNQALKPDSLNPD